MTKREVDERKAFVNTARRMAEDYKLKLQYGSQEVHDIYSRPRDKKRRNKVNNELNELSKTKLNINSKSWHLRISK
jgi:hypothetical protein